MNLNELDNQEIQQKHNELTDYFGKQNLQIDVKQEIINYPNPDSLFIDETNVKYIKIRITHLPTNKVAFGESYDSQLKNSVEALMKLKKEIKNTNAQH